MSLDTLSAPARAADAPVRPDASIPIKMAASGVRVFYGPKQALKGIDLPVGERQVTALIGPSGCGKSTFLRCLNRMNDTIDHCRVEGEILLDGEDIYRSGIDPVQLRA